MKRAGRSLKNPIVWGWILAGLCGCAAHRPEPSTRAHQFDFQRDTFSYPNELVWTYGYDAEGKWVSQRREPKPAYAQHCFILARSAQQFFMNARFDPEQPRVDDAAYRQLIRRVMAASPRHPLPADKQVIIPGYPGLRAFSQAHENLLKEECGGSWRCYVQRGNWRMILPFSRHQQAHVAEQLATSLETNGAAIVHAVRFPQLTINHALLIFGATETETGIQFAAYDPNDPQTPTAITFDRSTRSFFLPCNSYFPGGQVNVYQVYHQWDY
jgi:hypothetical protein